MFDRKKIIAYIDESGFASTADLCERFGISESTARRVLAQLSEAGKVQRHHGGAVSLQKREMTKAYSRIGINAEVKQRIGAKAAQLIKNGQTIVILSGSTVYHLCRYIKDKEITVITSSMLVFDELKTHSNIQMILLGGYYNHAESETAGYLTNTSPSFYRSDYLFMGTAGFDEFSGFTHDSYSVDIYRSCLSMCRQVCVLTDSSKYNRGGASAVAVKPNEVSYLFCDTGLSPTAVEHFENNYNVKVILADKD